MWGGVHIFEGVDFAYFWGQSSVATTKGHVTDGATIDLAVLQEKEKRGDWGGDGGTGRLGSGGDMDEGGCKLEVVQEECR